LKMAAKNDYWYGEQETGEERSLSVPFVNKNESDDDYIPDVAPTKSRLKLYVGVGLIVVALAGAGVGLSFYIRSLNDSGDDYFNSCYVAPSCKNINTAHVYNNVTGYTNNTGFASTSNDECCNICYPGMPQTVCFGADPDCAAKTGQSDYDYMLLDQIYFPQWCTALDKENHDPTLSHLNGTRCITESTTQAPALNIHGFWPNYYHGFPQCCSNATSVAPLVPSSVQNWGELYTNMQTKWYDPTTSATNSDGTACSTCYLQNHEWEKHGACFSTDPQLYFASGIAVFDTLSTITSTIAGMNGTTVPTASIAALYPNKVNVLCDPQSEERTADTGVFVELQTCWNSETRSVSSTELHRSVSSGDTVISGSSDSVGVSRGSVNVEGSRRESSLGATVYYNKHTRKVLGTTLEQVRLALHTTSPSSTTAEIEGEIEVVEFTSTDCMAASDGTFTMNCPVNTNIRNY